MKKKNTFFYLLLACTLVFISTGTVLAQDSIVNVPEVETVYIKDSFWGNRVFNGHSLDITKKGQLEFRIQHRLGRLVGGFNELFGLDQASIRLGLDYGITDWLMIGIGRSTLDKFYNGFVKVKMLRQSKGKRMMPLTLTGVADMGIASGKWTNPDRKNYFSSRLYYTFQFIIGRKFGNRVALQIAPTLVHRNLVLTSKDHNDVFSLGFGGQVRLSNMVALSAEFYYVFPHQIYSQVNGSNVTNNLSFGVEIYTGKHLFQIFVSNTYGSNEKQFITENTENWMHKGIHIGFNITRIFKVAHY
jgi:hypothetical protein